MAAIRKRGDGQWRAEVARKDARTGLVIRVSATRTTRAEAEAWAATIELSLRNGTYRGPHDPTDPDALRLRKLVQRYLLDVTPSKRGATQESNRLKAWLKHPLSDRFADKIEAFEWAAYRDQRLKTISKRGKPVSASTVRHELISISNVLEYARREWSMPVTNHIKTIRLPPAAKGREMSLSRTQYATLLEVIQRGRNGQTLSAAVEIARETGLRKSELLRLTWDDINLEEKALIVRESKNGSLRWVPLTRRAAAVLNELKAGSVDDDLICGQIFKAITADKLSRVASEAAATEEVGAPGFVFHDLRHEAASHLAPLLSVHELAKVLGHKTLQMVLRYYQPKVSDLSRKVW